MTAFPDLLTKITNRTAKVCIVGLGYIGLPTALFFAKAGYDVCGLDLNKNLVEVLSKGELPFFEKGLEIISNEWLPKISLHSEYDEILDADVYVLCLPSPVDENRAPILDHLEDSILVLARSISKPVLIVTESTVPVGTTEEFASLFKKSVTNQDIEVWFAHCPERVQPGSVVREMESNHRLTGGIDSESTDLARKLFSNVFGDDKVHGTTSRISEASKLAENAYRDTCIAYANELALICESLSIDVREVIRLANFHPRVDILQPGLGVGGYCFPKDGWILVNSAKAKGFESELIPTARKTNDKMPLHVFSRIENLAPEQLGTDAKIGILGLSYKPEVTDTRMSPSLDLIKLIRERGYKELAYDPLASTVEGIDRTDRIDDILQSCNVIVLCVGHKAIMNDLDVSELSAKVFVDPWGLRPEYAEKTNKYIGLTI